MWGKSVYNENQVTWVGAIMPEALLITAVHANAAVSLPTRLAFYATCWLTSSSPSTALVPVAQTSWQIACLTPLQGSPWSTGTAKQRPQREQKVVWLHSNMLQQSTVSVAVELANYQSYLFRKPTVVAFLLFVHALNKGCVALVGKHATPLNAVIMGLATCIQTITGCFPCRWGSTLLLSQSSVEWCNAVHTLACVTESDQGVLCKLTWTAPMPYTTELAIVQFEVCAGLFMAGPGTGWCLVTPLHRHKVWVASRVQAKNTTSLKSRQFFAVKVGCSSNIVTHLLPEAIITFSFCLLPGLFPVTGLPAAFTASDSTKR